MLKLRVVSAIVLASMMAWALFGWSKPAFAAFLAIFIFIGAWEWTALCGIRPLVARIAYVGLLGAVGIYLIIDPAWTQALLVMAVVFWAWVLLELLVLRKLEAGWLPTWPGKLIGGFLVLLPAWLVPLLLREEQNGKWLALFVMMVVWGADTGAYFAGHRFGRHKLAPHVSPGKTWEGVAGGLGVVLLLALVLGPWLWNLQGTALMIWIVLALATALVSVLGDLFESRIKRLAGVKDSGTLIPGHGGVLDRIDAFTAAAPFFALVWLLWRPVSGA
jgi:phosphatidate cytidylyltransferase